MLGGGFNEAALQRLWFEHALPRHLLTSDGQRAEIVQTGWWNREGGPDFRDAAVRFGGKFIRSGDVEMHLDAADWERHGHHRDPAYNTTVLHVALAGKSPVRLECGELIPTVELAMQLTEPIETLLAQLGQRPWKGGERLAHPGACAVILGKTNTGRLRGLLLEAGRHRLWQKAGRMARQWRRDGLAQTLWESVADGLGYAENQIPFRLLARKAPARALKRMSPLEREARLFGLAGFLPRVQVATWGYDGRDHAAMLWRHWWSSAGACDVRPVPAHLWERGRSRPANHPHRRVAALAVVSGSLAALLRALRRRDFSSFAAILSGLNHAYFECHSSLGSRPAPRKLALIGEARIRDLLVNLAAPWALALRADSLEWLEGIPATQQNRVVTLAAQRLLGGAAGAYRPSSALEQQGLLHIYHGFCATDATDCGDCRLPDIATQWLTGGNRSKDGTNRET